MTPYARNSAYSHGADRPLRSYGAILTGYGLAVATGAVIARLSGRRIPELDL